VDSARPPSHDPPAFPTLNADVASADTSVGASLAACRAWATRIGVSTNAVAPSSNTSVTATATLDAHSAVAASTQAVSTAAGIAVPNGRRSPRRPPVIVPSSAPAPKPSSASGTNFSGSPARVVSSGET